MVIKRASYYCGKFLVLYFKVKSYHPQPYYARDAQQDDLQASHVIDEVSVWHVLE